MLVEFQLQNFTSFNQKQTFSMLASSATKEDLVASNTITVNRFGIDKLLGSDQMNGVQGNKYNSPPAAQ